MGILKKWKKLHQKGVLLNYFYHQLTLSRIKIKPFYLVREGLFPLDNQTITTKLSPCETFMLKPSDIRIIAAYKERDQSEDEMLAMLKNDCYCMGIKHNDKIVAYGWFELKNCAPNYVSFPLKKNEAYLSGVRTLKTYRGNNLAPYLRYQMYEHLNKIGRTTLYSITDFSNVPSISFKKKLGAYNLKLYLSIRITKYFHRVWLLRTYPEKHFK